MSNDWIFYTQLLSVFTYVGIALGLYRLLVKQKDAALQNKDSIIELLQKQLEAAKQESPDIVLKKLDERVQIARDEMERLSKDKEALAGLNEKASLYIDSLKEVISANEAVISALKKTIKLYEENREEMLRVHEEYVIETKKGFQEYSAEIKNVVFDIMDKLQAEGRTIKAQLDENGVLQEIIIIPVADESE